MWYWLLISLFFIIYFYLKNVYRYWENRGVPSAQIDGFRDYIFGNLTSALTMKENLGQLYTKLYQESKSLPYFGFYKMRAPALLINDPRIIKDIMIKEFDSFSANDMIVDQSDTLTAKNPFSQSGDKWKKTRSILNPCYSSGKVKTMFPLIEATSNNLVSYIKSESIKDENLSNGLELKELCTKFTVDVVADCAFGLEGQSFIDPKAEFREMGMKLFNPSIFTAIKHLVMFVAPPLTKIFKIKFIPDEAGNYFRSIISSTIDYRKSNSIIRNDFLNQMMELKSKAGGEFTNEDITAHALGFFIDGFETSATALNFALYLLAQNKKVQSKLRDEICEVLAKHEGQLSYEAIQEMTYLDCVFNESFRIYPPFFFQTRQCTKNYVLKPIDGVLKEFTIEAGTSIIFPIYGIQTNDKYFKDPNEFRPERFEEKNRQSMEKCIFMPFGEGPKNCLGQRFGITQIKVGIINVIKHFELQVNKKTIEPIQFDPKRFMNAVVGGIWVNFKEINN